MKRFLIAVIAGAALLLGIYFMIYYLGFYIPSNPSGEIDIPFKTRGKELVIRETDGEYAPFFMKGVEVSASMPGHYATEFYADENDYLRWFRQIQEMGANTVKAARIMDDEFYNALYYYNTEHGTPLYLLQGIAVSDEANYGTADGYHKKYLGQLLEDGKALVDIIHGRKAIPLGELGGSGAYHKDISRWVIGYVVGNHWNPDAVAYTDHKIPHRGGYSGTYISSNAEATAFEAMLAQVMDGIVSYENEKYDCMRPIGFVSNPENDFLEYDENYALQLRKYSSVDMEHLTVSGEMKAGIFAAYQLFDYCRDFSEYLSSAQKTALGEKLNGLNRTSSYDGYIQLLSRYHTMPVLITEYGFSSARGAVKIGEEPDDEKTQGKRLTEVYRDARKYGCIGVCISSWQDIWERRTWNTSFAVNQDHRNLWHDIQTDGQNYGLMEFAPGKEVPVCTIDGDPGEWTEEDRVLAEDGVTLYVRYDQEGIYLLLKGEKLSKDSVRYVPIDICGDVGSQECAAPKLTFDRRADFLLCLNGPKNTKLLVQDRYQAVRERFEFEIDGRNSYTSYPDKDSTEFTVVQMALENHVLLENFRSMDPLERRSQTSLGLWDTGNLLCGSEDSKSRDYSSLADFYFGDDCVELRIPWLLLNVGDPTVMAAHKDYYENYGVEHEEFQAIWLGIAAEGHAEMKAFRVKGTGRKPEVHERLKDSYYVIREEWKREDISDVSNS